MPLASIAVPLSGIFVIVGGLSTLLGYRARLGAGLIMLFLVRTIVMMDRFWAMHDPLMAGIHVAFFMENVASIGGALLISQFGAGPFSVVANAVSDGLDEVSSERTVHLELLLKEKKYFSAELNLAKAHLNERLASC